MTKNQGENNSIDIPKRGSAKDAKSPLNPRKINSASQHNSTKAKVHAPSRAPGLAGVRERADNGTGRSARERRRGASVPCNVTPGQGSAPLGCLLLGAWIPVSSVQSIDPKTSHGLVYLKKTQITKNETKQNKKNKPKKPQ